MSSDTDRATVANAARLGRLATKFGLEPAKRYWLPSPPAAHKHHECVLLARVPERPAQ